MELGSEEKYAAAAIFTLALHLSQTDAGLADGQGTGQGIPSAWGQQDSWDGAEETEHIGKADEKAAQWLAYWGWDCCGPDGILDCMYRALGVPERSWSGLKQLPEVGGLGTQRRGYMRMVSSYIGILDSELPKLYFQDTPKQGTATNALQLHPGAVAEATVRADSLDLTTASGGDVGVEAEAAAQRAVRDDLFEGLICSDSDSDLEEDLANVHLQQRLLEHSNSWKHRRKLYSQAEALLRALEQQPVEDLGPLTAQEACLSEEYEPSAPQHNPDTENQSKAESELLKVPLSEVDKTEESTAVAAALSEASNPAVPEVPVALSVGSAPKRTFSAKAVGALWELLEASVSQARQPVVGNEDDEKDDSPGPSLVGGLPPVQRFYDARTRTSLKYVANWLGVPWSKMVAFEQLLAHQLLVPDEREAGAVATPWEKSIRAAKIGAATLGIGAIFAVTGGIAAPAIAAGVGAAIGLAGGTAAMASGVSAFLASTAGGAIVASTVGAAGGGVALKRVANRIGEVKEFGFWEVDAEALLATDPAPTGPVQDHPPAASEAPDSSQSAHTGRVSQSAPRKWHPLQQASAHGSSSQLDNGLERKGNRSRKGKQQGQAGEGDNDAYFRKPSEARDPFLHSDNVQARAASAAARELSTIRSSSMELAEPDRLAVKRDSAIDAAARESEQPGNDADSGHIMLQPEPGVSGGGAAGERFAVEPARRGGSPVTRARQNECAKDSRKASEEAWWQSNGWKEPPMLLTPIATGRRVDDMRLSLTIGINGWVSRRQDFISIWVEAAAGQKSTELFTLVWESKELIALNNAIVDFISNQAGQEAIKWTVQHFFFTGLVAALALPALVYSMTQIIDTAWSVALQRAQQAGRLLAHILAAGAHGDRPVILVGYSMGARLVFHCLLELSRLHSKGIVEHACMLGMPVALRPERWAMARSVVAGRLINGYSRKDWLLFAVYRGTNGFLKTPAGLCPVPCPGVENVNLTSIIDGHFDYIDKMGEVLELVDMF